MARSHAAWRRLFSKPFARSAQRVVRALGDTEHHVLVETLQAQLERTTTYGEWRRVCRQLDALQGLGEWKQDASSSLYDYQRVQRNLVELRRLVARAVADPVGQLHPLMFYLRARVVRNMGNIGNRRLYAVLRDGTKELIEEFQKELVSALRLVAALDAPGAVDAAEKLAFFSETRHSFGRSALLLSGGATLGMYHAGVIKALRSVRLLPRIISGASVGSIIAAIVGTRMDSELDGVFDRIDLNFFPPSEGAVSRKLKRLLQDGVLMDIKILERCVRSNVPDLTFQEAYDRTGRIINIVISPGRGERESSRLLNYLTAPHVLVWSAAIASCAIPGVYAPVELVAKDKDGNMVPYYETGLKWSDGSVRADLPMRRLAELFNVNHFIVSQTNPHVLPFLTKAAYSRSVLGGLVPRVMHFLRKELKAFMLNLGTLGILPSTLRVWRDILDQQYVGDITIWPEVAVKDYSLLLQNPTLERFHKCIAESERSTWERISQIQTACSVEFTLDECVRTLRAQLILQAEHTVTPSPEPQRMAVRAHSFQDFAPLVTSASSSPLLTATLPPDHYVPETVRSARHATSPGRFHLPVDTLDEPGLAGPDAALFAPPLDLGEPADVVDEVANLASSKQGMSRVRSWCPQQFGQVFCVRSLPPPSAANVDFEALASKPDKPCPVLLSDKKPCPPLLSEKGVAITVPTTTRPSKPVLRIKVVDGGDSPPSSPREGGDSPPPSPCDGNSPPITPLPRSASGEFTSQRKRSNPKLQQQQQQQQHLNNNMRDLESGTDRDFDYTGDSDSDDGDNDDPDNTAASLWDEWLSILLLVFLYLLQGIPLGLSLGSIKYLLQDHEGVSYTDLGVYSLASYPYSLKLLWSPVVDSFWIDALGRRKSWIVPIQLLIGIFMWCFSGPLEAAISAGRVHYVTAVVFVLVFLVATQDIAVDGWAITMLSPKNRSYASTCQAVGQNIGFFLSFTVFLALNSPQFCNTYLRSPQDAELLSSVGVVTLSSFLRVTAVVYITATVGVLLFKRERRFVPRPGREISVRAVYRNIWAVLQLPSVRRLIVVLLTCRVAFAAADQVALSKLIEKGFPKESLGMLALVQFPWELLIPLIVSRYMSRGRLLRPFHAAYLPRVCLTLVAAWMVYVFPENQGSISMTTFAGVALFQMVYSFCVNCMFVSQCGFFAHVSDPHIGGTYMTLLNTVANLGNQWPGFFTLSLVDVFSCRPGKEAVDWCVLPEGTDGFYVMVALCVLIGVAWFSIMGRETGALQHMKRAAWMARHQRTPTVQVQPRRSNSRSRRRLLAD